MKTGRFQSVLLASYLIVIGAYADTHYVSTSGGNSAPYTSWADAAATIQDAVDAAASGDLVLVNDGTYSSGGAEVYSMGNRVALTKAVTLQSVNGPDNTTISGAGPLGSSAVRCAYVTNGAVIAGFTLTNGHTHSGSTDLERERSGGGVWLDGGGIVSNCTISGNIARRDGSGVYLYGGGTLTHCTISGNSARANGGAFCNGGGTLSHCSLSGNTADSSGGGVYCSFGGTLENCAISGNESGLLGGGAALENGGVLNNCTLSRNSGGIYGGGVYCYEGGTLNNCILWGNSASNGGNWYEYISGDGTFVNSCTTPKIGGSCVSSDPQFEDGGAGDYRLRFGSPCIDAGITLAWITDDLDGIPRPLNGDNSGGAQYDIGAYEFGWPVVRNTNDSGSGSLRQMLEWVGADETITFSSAIDGKTITLSSGQLLVERSVTIDASSLAEGLAIDANAASRIFEFAAGTTNVLDRLTLTNGYVSGSAPDHNGGAIYVNSNAVLAINRSSICGNYSTHNGGGIYNIGTAMLTFNECTISDNSAGYAGGGIKNYGTTSINNSTLAGNSCSAIGGGGAIQNFEGYLTLNHVTVSGNSSDGKGGGIRNTYLGMMVCTNSIICENTSTQGSNIHDDGTLSTHGCLIDTDPMLAPLGDYGGPTQTMPPLPGSPAVDAGVAHSLTSDQRGIARPLDGDGDGITQTDIGACESDEDTTPLLAITSPASGTVLNKIVTETTLSGTHNERVVGAMIWTNAASGASGTIGVSGSEFQVPSIALAVGANLITVLGTNVYGSVASDSITITRNIEYEEHGGISRIHYVSTNGTAVWPFTNLTTAANIIQDAVEAAVDGDTVLVNDGTYSSGGAEIASVSNRVALTKAVTLQSVNGPQATVIVGAADPITTNGPAAVRCVLMNSSGAVLSGFTLTNGHTHASGAWPWAKSGGGIGLTGGGIVSNCIVSGNAARSDGGGIYAFDGGLITHCTITGNSCRIYGGGVFCDDAITLNNSVIRDNSANTEAGGVFCSGDATLNNCVITGNSSLLAAGGASQDQDATLNNCTISGNSAVHGGGVCHWDDATLNNCIVWDNTAGTGANWHDHSGGTVAYTNICTTPLPTNGINCIANDPMFADSGADDYRLQPGSPCIDAGTTLAAISDDFDGTPRPFDGDGDGAPQYDIGAYEFDIDTTPALAITNPVNNTTVDVQTTAIDVSGTNNQWTVGSITWTNAANASNGTFAVSGLTFHVISVPLEFGANRISILGTNVFGSAASESVTITRSSEHEGDSRVHYVAAAGTGIWPFANWSTAATSIQAALDAAVAGDVVLVTNGVYDSGGAQVYSMSNRVALTKAVTLQSVNGPEATFIVGASHGGTNGPAAVRCAYVTNGAVVAGFTLTNGHTRTGGSSLTYERSGGGAFLDGGGIVSNCTLRGNFCDANGGGAFCNVGGTLDRCILEDNQSGRRGGGVICFRGGVLSECTLSGNTSGWDGGGVFCDTGGILNRCIISRNSAGWNGGGVGFYERVGILNNCLIGDNTAARDGGGVYCLYGGTLNNCTLNGNSAVDEGGGVYCHSGLLPYGGVLNNCIVWGNTANTGANWDEDIDGYGSFANVCITPLPTNALNCITNDPQFADAGAADYRLQPTSPCIDAGITLAAITNDIEGTSRPLNGDGGGEALPDIGAYEHSSPLYSTDGDPHTDYEEYIAGTDPTNSNHWFGITGIAGDPSGIEFWPSSVDRLYTLWYSTNLVEGVWTPVPGQVDLPGNGGTNSLAHTNSYPAAFYRVEVELIE